MTVAMALVGRTQPLDRRAELRSDYRDLMRAREQLEYDRRHHARRRKIAEDEARIRDIEREINADRRAATIDTIKDELYFLI